METPRNGGGEGIKDVMVGKKKTTVRFSDMVLRLMALAFTLAAAITVGVDKQTKVVPLTVVSTLPPIYVPVTAKWQYLSAFTYFMVANAIACSYGALSLILTTVNNRGGKKGVWVMAIIILDLVTVALLASAIGAVAGVGMIGYQGNSHLQWRKVCNVFGKFCNQVAAALVVSFLGSITYLFLVMLAALELHKKHY